MPIPSPGVSLEFGQVGHPLVIVVHDQFGRLPGVEQFAQALVRHGFRVVVPDLFGGVATTDSAAAERLVSELDVAVALRVLDDLVAVAREQGSGRVGVVGFSVGGWIALLHAQGGEADAVVAYYATLSDAEHGVIPCAVQLHLAEVDEWAVGADPDSFVERLRDHGTPIRSFSYLGTRAGFANATAKVALNADAAALAFARSARFLQEHLLD